MHARIDISRRLLHLYGIKFPAVIKALRYFAVSAVEGCGDVRKPRYIRTSVSFFTVYYPRGFANPLDIADYARVYAAFRKVDLKGLGNGKGFILIYYDIYAYFIEAVIVVNRSGGRAFIGKRAANYRNGDNRGNQK